MLVMICAAYSQDEVSSPSPSSSLIFGTGVCGLSCQDVGHWLQAEFRPRLESRASNWGLPELYDDGGAVGVGVAFVV